MWGDTQGWLVALNYPAGDTPPKWIEILTPEKDEAIRQARAWAAEHLPECVVQGLVPVLDL
ncbi:MAG: hypothetical protein AB1666_08560 [Pseudomonadota bacterium]